MTDTKQTERQRRYYARKRAQAMAVFAHATEIELAWFGVNRDGEHIAVGYDGQPIKLIVRAGATLPDLPAPDDPVEAVAPRAKKVYPPKSWDGARWNRTVEQVRKGGHSKSSVISQLASADNLDTKQKAHATAVIEALPDVPDWYNHLPMAEESEK